MSAIIIWGSPRSWKTSLWYFFKQHHWEHREFDFFKIFLRNSISDSESLNRLWNYGSKSIWDAKESAADIFEHYVETTKLMENGLKSVFEKIDLKEDIVIECTYISPKLLYELKGKHPWIYTICTGIDTPMQSEACIAKWLESNPRDWIHTIGIHHVEKAVRTFVMLSQHIKAECRKYGVEYVNYEIPRDIWLQKTYDTILLARKIQP